MVEKDLGLWLEHLKDCHKNNKDIHQHYIEKNSCCKVFDQMVPKKTLEMAKKTLYFIEFCIKIKHSKQFSCYST